MVERWIPLKGHPGGGIRKDLFDCMDLIALTDRGIVGIQCGAMGGHVAHVQKCMASVSLRKWLVAGGSFIICSWGKMASKKKDGSKGVPRWAMKEQEIIYTRGPDGPLKLKEVIIHK